MTPKEKAEELINKMWLHSGAQDGPWMDKDMAKQCALIAVDEICEFYFISDSLGYWHEVRYEITQL
jgi:hypothetical protein